MTGLLDFLKTPEGQGLLSATFGGLAGARRGTPFNNIGRAGLAGLAGYSGAQDRIAQSEEAAVQRQMRDMQMKEAQRKQAELEAQQKWRAGLPGAMKQSEPTYGAGEEGPTMTPGNPNALNEYLARPESPFFDEVIKQQLFPSAEDYRVVGGDLLKIGKGGVTVAHRSERQDSLPADQKLYNLAVEQGYKGDFMSFKRALVSNTESAKADFDLMPITTPDGQAYMVPRSSLVGGAAKPKTAPRSSGYQGGSAAAASTGQREILASELDKAVKEGRTEDAASIRRELSRIPGGIQVQSEAEKLAASEGVKLKASSEAATQKDRTTARKFLNQARVAEELLNKNPTGSGIGAARDNLLGFFGQSTPASEAAKQLEAVSGWLVSNVPRMEGPQSNFDVDNYMRMAGAVGDKTKPVAERLAALQTIQNMMREVMGEDQGGKPASTSNGNKSSLSGGGWSAVKK